MMTPPAKPWSDQTAAEKREAVKAQISAGLSYRAIADELGAPNRNCIASVASRLREAGDLPPAPSKQKTGAAGGAVVRIRAKTSRDKATRKVKGSGLDAINIAVRKQGREDAPGIIISSAAAFDPIHGISPVPFALNTGCRWPVDGYDGSGLTCCGGIKHLGHAYCDAHRRLSYRPATRNEKAAVRAAGRAS